MLERAQGDTRQRTIDVDLLHQAAEAAQQHEIAWAKAYTAYSEAVEGLVDALIALHPESEGTPEARHARRSGAAVIAMRKRSDDAQRDRVDSQGMYREIVKLITGEMRDAINYLLTTVEQQSAVLVRQQEYINEIRTELEKSNTL